MAAFPQDSGYTDPEDSQRFIAGWMDGNAFGRLLVLGTFRHDAEHHGLTCDGEGTVFSSRNAAEIPVEPAVHPDNPEGSEAYDRGWERGRNEVVTRMARRLRIQLVEHDLFVTATGRVAPVGIASDAAESFCTNTFGAAAPVTDDALHAFIDGAATNSSEAAVSPSEAAATALEPSTPSAATTPSPDESSAPLPRSFFDRRTLLGAATGALLGGAGTISIMRTLAAANRDSQTSAQSGGPSYTPPAWWDSEPAVVKNFYLAWDQLVWNLEQDPGDLESLRSSLRTVMQTPGFDSLKQNVFSFMLASQRSLYIGDLLHALIPGSSSSLVHSSLFASLRGFVADLGVAVVDFSSRQALLAYRALSLAPEATVNESFELLMADLGL